MGDYNSALKKARSMRDILLAHGVPEVSIELRQGRPSSYGTWDALFTVAEMSHHTVSRYGTNKTPCLALVKNGRSDLPGPLCNGYGGWDLCYRIITFGYANHPGSGGPKTVPALTAGKFTIPKDSARRYVWGTEFEGGLSKADWDKVLTNPRNGKKMTYREFMGRVNAALEEFLEIHEGAHLEHSTWTSRKIDRLGYTQASGIAEKKKYKAKPKKEKPAKKKPIVPKVDLSNVRGEFRAYLGLEGKKKPTYHVGVKRIQKALNDRYDLNLKEDGIVGKATADAWAKHEKKVGVVNRPRVPDAATLSVLARKPFKVKP